MPAESSEKAIASREAIIRLALVGGCTAAFVVAIAQSPLHLRIPGHRAIFWLPPLLASGLWGIRGGGSLAAGAGSMLILAMGVITPAKVAGYLLAGGAIDVIRLCGWHTRLLGVIIAGIAAHLSRLVPNIVIAAATGMPITRAQPHLLDAVVYYTFFGSVAALLTVGVKSLVRLVGQYKADQAK